MSNSTSISWDIEIVRGAITIFVFFVTTWVKGKIEKQISHNNERKLLSEELQDVVGHLSNNIKIFNNIDLKFGVPSIHHYKKMIIPVDSIIFSSQTFRTINPKYSKLIYRIRLVIRNYNIDIEAIIEYINKGNCDIEILKQYNRYVIDKNKFTLVRLDQMVTDLQSKSGKKTHGTGAKTPLNIIYPQKW